MVIHDRHFGSIIVVQMPGCFAFQEEVLIHKTLHVCCRAFLARAPFSVQNGRIAAGCAFGLSRPGRPPHTRRNKARNTLFAAPVKPAARKAFSGFIIAVPPSNYKGETRRMRMGKGGEFYRKVHRPSALIQRLSYASFSSLRAPQTETLVFLNVIFCV